MKRIKLYTSLCLAAITAVILFSGCHAPLEVDFDPLTVPGIEPNLSIETHDSLPLIDRDLPTPVHTAAPYSSPSTTTSPTTEETSSSSATTEETSTTTTAAPTTTTKTKTTTTKTTTKKTTTTTKKTTAKTTTRKTTAKTTRPTATTTKKSTTTTKKTTVSTTTTEKTTSTTSAKPSTTTAASTTSKTTTKPAEGTNRPDLALEVLRLVNEKRAAQGLYALTLNQSLTDSAELRATEVAIKQRHTRPDGTSYRTTITIPYARCTEIIAWGGNRKTPEQVVNGWSKSDDHAPNLVTTIYTEVGIGCCNTNKWPYWSWSMIFIIPTN